MGPSKDDSNRRGEEIYKEVMDLIWVEEGIRCPELDGSSFSKELKRDWLRQEMRIKKAIQELVWIDVCANF
jgi:hypothetical protein